DGVAPFRDFPVRRSSCAPLAAASLTRHRPVEKPAAVGTPAARNWFLGYKAKAAVEAAAGGLREGSKTVAQKARRIDMNEQRNGERIWDIIERIGVCMLTTQAAGRLRARPLEARPDRISRLDLCRDRRPQRKARRDRGRARRRPRADRREGESL